MRVRDAREGKGRRDAIQSNKARRGAKRGNGRRDGNVGRTAGGSGGKNMSKRKRQGWGGKNVGAGNEAGRTAYSRGKGDEKKSGTRREETEGGGKTVVARQIS